MPAAAGNSITLTGADGAFSFTGQKFGGPANELIVSCDGTIPVNTLGVGIGMSGSPIMLPGWHSGWNQCA